MNHTEKIYNLIESNVFKYIDEISLDKINVPSNLFHDTLNPKIWDENQELKPYIREHIIDIANKFCDSLDVDKIKIDSIKFVGSMANYNWNNQSDIDIHIFVDFSKINKDKKIVTGYLEAKKDLWNQKHDIKIKGFPAEIYVQDIDSSIHSSAIFNITKNEWEKIPDKDNVKIDSKLIAQKIQKIITQIESIDSGMLTDEEAYNVADNIKEKIKKLRVSGLEEKGEFSDGNIIFKFLRNRGYLQKLSDIKLKHFDDSLSI